MRFNEDPIRIEPARTTTSDLLPPNNKRPSAVLEAETRAAVKRRASRACQSCRSRKVRCDVTATVSQCTNCQIDNIECVVLASKRGRTARRKGTSVISNADNSSPPLQDCAYENHVTANEDTTSSRLREDLSPLRLIAGEADLSRMSSPISPELSGPVPVSVTFDQELDKERRDQPPAESDALEGIAGPSVVEAHSGALTSELEPQVMACASANASLPAFISKIPARISKEDLDFLVRKGALSIPEPGARMEILRGYLYAVHPFMPMLEFQKFSQAVSNNREDRQVSLLLFQAVMFAGLHPLKMEVIRRLGFASVKQAREVFFQRVRLLYEFDVERDSAAILQSLLLMSNHYGKWDERRHTWHWTGLAYDVARNMGLHREPTTRFGSKRVRHFRRRLWWSLYIRDRLIALGTRRPMRILDHDFDVAMLKLEDFDTEEISEPVQLECLHQEAGEKISIARMCVQLAELCKHIGHVVSSQYTVLNSHPDVPYTMMVVSKRSVEDTQELESCDRELEEWYQTLGSTAQSDGSCAAPNDPNSCAGVHWTILKITYMTTLNVLHRAQALQPPPESPDARGIQISSRLKIKNTARNLTKLLRTMLTHDHVCYLGPVGVTALVAASLSHILDLRAEDEDVRDAVTWRLTQNLQVLQALREIYASADAAISFLTTIIQKAGGRVPVATLESATADSINTPSIASNHTNIDLPDQRLHSLEAKQQFKSFQTSTQGEEQQAQSQNVYLKNGNFPGSTSLASHGSIPPPADTSTASNNPLILGSDWTDMAGDSLISDLYSDRGIDSTFGGLSSSAAHGAFLDWNYDSHAGIDLDEMVFSHDFYRGNF